MSTKNSSPGLPSSHRSLSLCGIAGSPFFNRIAGLVLKGCFLTLISGLIAVHASAQTGFGTTIPDPHSVLDINSTQKGLLLPRLTTEQQSTLAATLTTTQTGMVITDASSGIPLYWNGTSWINLTGATTINASSPLSISATNTVSLNPGTATGDLITWDGANWINMQPATQHFSITQDNRQPYLTINYCIALVGVFPSQNSSEPFLSEIELYGFNFPPKGFAFCNGQLLPINQNAALFSLIGTFYGGNGINTFALPNLQGRVPLHYGNGAGLSPYTLGQTGGVESNTITK
jgi:microcystin-dependent protein